MTTIALMPSSPGLDAHTVRLQADQRSGIVVIARHAVTAIVIALALTSVWTHRHQLGAGFRVLGHISWWWIPAALVFQGVSLASAALLQRVLLRAGDIDISAVDITRISMAANAISSTLPGGSAWSTPWSWKQLRRHGADRRLASWVVIASGVMSSFVLFVIIVAGSELAGDHGPVASLRWLGRALATASVVAGLLLLATRARRRSDTPPVGRLARLYERTRVVRLSPSAWASALLLALANWVLDLACLIACIAAVGARIDWRGIVIIYSLTQLIGAVPITPGGLGVVEAGLTALLVSYGTPAPSAIAAVVVYRALTFWAIVPAGWMAWWRLDKPRSIFGSSAGEYQFRQGVLPYMEFSTVPASVSTGRTPDQAPLGLLINQRRL